MSLGGLLFVMGSGLSLVALYTCGCILYNIFLHPLRNFPGPFCMRATRLAYCYKLMNGTLPFDMLAIHQKYGHVVRIAPDELAFADHEAWKEIMGHRIKENKRPEFEKSAHFYRPLGGPSSLVNCGREEHGALRRLMSHGFSDRSLREQQPLITKYVDLLIQRLHENCHQPVDIMSWYNFTTFDVIGDLAFGEPFGCLDGSDYHPWVRTIFQMVKLGSVLQVAAYFPLLRYVILRILSSKAIWARREEHTAMTREKLLRRMELGASGGRPDLVKGLLQGQDSLGLSMDQVLKNSGLLIIGGSETTATLLSGVTFLFLTHPDTLRQLTEEVRTSFAREEDIDFTSVNKLSYMIACLDEALRIYPPVPGGLPRVIPKGGSVVSGRFIPEKTIVAIHQWAMYHSKEHFKDPFEFRPERCMGDPEFAQDHRDAFQPFHIGPRNCLGRNLAYVEMRIILARVIWNFDMTLANESRDWHARQKVYILWDKGPLMVHLQPVARDQASESID